MSVTRTYRTAVLGVVLVAGMLAAGIALAGEGGIPFRSPAAAYDQGVAAEKAGRMELAIPALEFAAEAGLARAQLKLAQVYSGGHGVEKDDAKAFRYFSRIANRYADLPRRHRHANLVADAFVRLGDYYRNGIDSIDIRPNAYRAASLYRHAASYFGDAVAQFRLANLHLAGEGVARSTRAAVRWLTLASRKKHAPSQALLGELLWKGDEGFRAHPARALALATAAKANAQGKSKTWIVTIYERIFSSSKKADRERAKTMAKRWRRHPAAPAGPVLAIKPLQLPEIYKIPPDGPPERVSPPMTAFSVSPVAVEQSVQHPMAPPALMQSDALGGFRDSGGSRGGVGGSRRR